VNLFRFSTVSFNAPRWAAFAANLALLVLWGWLFHPVYPYLGVIFTRQEFRTNQVVLLAVLVLIVLQVRRSRFPLSLGALPQWHPPSLALALAGAAGFVAAERWLDINTLSATLFGLATYGLLGLWMAPSRWRAGLPAALLLVGVLPFGEHMETFIGYPVRLATARLVSGGWPVAGGQPVQWGEEPVDRRPVPAGGHLDRWPTGEPALAAGGGPVWDLAVGGEPGAGVPAGAGRPGGGLGSAG
jgi:hypothetical protein